MIIQDKIRDAIASCREAGRNPVLIVIHPKIFAKLMDELDGFAKLLTGRSYQMFKHPRDYGTYQGVSLFVSSMVKDFFVVDDRSWVEQKW